jgi:hypothetical protein
MSNQGGGGANSKIQGGQKPAWAKGAPEPMPTQMGGGLGSTRPMPPGAKIGGLTPINGQQPQGGAPQHGTQQPAPGTPGSTQYQQLNQSLQTGPMQFASNMLGGNGVSQAGQSAMNQMGQMGQSGSNSLMNQAAENFGGTASGQFLNGSPQLNSIIDRSNRNVADQTNQMFAAGGRYGSGAHQGTLADSIGSNTNNLLNANYQQERDRQMQASGQLGQLGQNQFGNQMGALQGAASIGQQGIGNQLNTISQMPNIQNNKIFDAQQQMGVGQQLDNRNQQQLNDLINRWTQGDMQGWQRLGGLLSAGGQSAGSWGTQTGTSNTSQNPSPLGMAGAGLSMLSKSDRRAKKNIRRVGRLDNGLEVYAYRYKSGGPTVIGVMADEVRKVKPWAVTPIEGVDHVNYDRAVA